MKRIYYCRKCGALDYAGKYCPKCGSGNIVIANDDFLYLGKQVEQGKGFIFHYYI